MLNNTGFNLVDLYRLQLAENKIKFYEREIQKLRDDEELLNRKEELKEAQAQLDEFNKVWQELETQRKKLENEVSLKVSKIKGNEQKLSSGTLTSSKEIIGLNEEIESLKKINAEIENKMLEIMMKADDVEEEISIKKEKNEKIAAYVKRLNDELEEKIAAKEKVLNKYKDKKEQVILKIPAAELEGFKEVSNKRGGVAIGILKEQLCCACNMEMSMIEALNMDREDISYRCPNCKRMLIRYRPEIDAIDEEYDE